MLRSYSRGLLQRAQHQHHSCFTRRWFQAIPVIDVEPLVTQQKVRYLLLRLLSSLAKAQQAQPSTQDAAEVAQQLHRACNEVGFFYVSSIVPMWTECLALYTGSMIYFAGSKSWGTNRGLPECAQRSTCLVCSAGNYLDSRLHVTLWTLGGVTPGTN